ncbi:MAG TPA: molybdate ABC transporter substrate-binding protein [Candidatus Eisenbacteria bacterium]|nr:molybdate ABC transporter substrate-binding protein [Candidatus Eisenbacteria bacterium]
MKGLRACLVAAVLCFTSSVPIAHAAGAPKQTLRVFAAASLADAFREIATAFEREHPGLEVQLNLAGSQQLASQLANGAAADVFASADERWMSDVREKQLVDGEPRVFAHNRLVVILPRTNPARIGRLQDLTRRGIKLVVGADAVPVGRYSREMLQNLARLDGFDVDYARRVLANVVSEEENVKSVVGKVQLGEADAGIVYRSDVTPAIARYVRAIEIPEPANVLARYPIATLAGSRMPDDARAFVALVLSPSGQSVLQRRGIMPVTGTP